MTLTAASLAAWAGCATFAFAGQLEGAACAARLAPTGQMMFQAVAEHVKSDSDIATLMRERVRPLVMTGRISREDAKQNGQAVAKCLLLLK
jgi:hypothetical protein